MFVDSAYVNFIFIILTFAIYANSVFILGRLIPKKYGPKTKWLSVVFFKYCSSNKFGFFFLVKPSKIFPTPTNKYPDMTCAPNKTHITNSRKENKPEEKFPIFGMLGFPPNIFKIM